MSDSIILVLIVVKFYNNSRNTPKCTHGGTISEYIAGSEQIHTCAYSNDENKVKRWTDPN